jgi:hypothetical protein
MMVVNEGITMGLFVSLDKLSISSVAKKGNCVLENEFWSKGNGMFIPDILW